MHQEKFQDHYITFPAGLGQDNGQLVLLEGFIILDWLRKYEQFYIDVWDAFQKGQVEIIKTGWPHGVTIQVSFVDKCGKWMLSDGRRSRLIDDG